MSVNFAMPLGTRRKSNQLLRQHNVALFLHDWRGERSPVELTADFTYVRFHGAAGKYQGNYTPQMLGTWADMIQGWLP